MKTFRTFFSFSPNKRAIFTGNVTLQRHAEQIMILALCVIMLSCAALTGCGGGGEGTGNVGAGGTFPVYFSSNFNFEGNARSSSGYWHNGTPLEGVLVKVDTGNSTLTSPEGYFLLRDNSGGTRTFTFSKEQFEQVSLILTSWGDWIVARVQLPPTKTIPNRTSLRVTAYGDYVYDPDSSGEDFMTAQEIHVTRDGDQERRWSAYFDSSLRSSTILLDGVQKGALYNIEVQWSNFGSHSDWDYYLYTIEDSPENVVEIWR